MRVRSAGDGGFAGNRGITTVAIGQTRHPDGSRRPALALVHRGMTQSARLGRRCAARTKCPQSTLAGRIAIIGTSAPGLLDLRATPLDPVISGVEINAQAIEQLLVRPPSCPVRLCAGDGDRPRRRFRRCCWALWFIVGVRGSRPPSGSPAFAYLLSAACGHSRKGCCSMPSFPIMTSSAAYIFGTGYLYYEAESERNRGREALHRIAQGDGSGRANPATFLPKESPPALWITRSKCSRSCSRPKPSAETSTTTFSSTIPSSRSPSVTCRARGCRPRSFMSMSRTVLRTVAFERPKAASRDGSVKGQRHPLARQCGGHVRHDLLCRARSENRRSGVLERRA